MVWSASEDGTLRQHDFREGTSCPPAGSSQQECRNVLVRPALHNKGFPFVHFYVIDTSMRTLFVEVIVLPSQCVVLIANMSVSTKYLFRKLAIFDLLSSSG